MKNNEFISVVAHLPQTGMSVQVAQQAGKVVFLKKYIEI